MLRETGRECRGRAGVSIWDSALESARCMQASREHGMGGSPTWGLRWLRAKVLVRIEGQD